KRATRLIVRVQLRFAAIGLLALRPGDLARGAVTAGPAGSVELAEQRVSDVRVTAALGHGMETWCRLPSKVDTAPGKGDAHAVRVTLRGEAMPYGKGDPTQRRRNFTRVGCLEAHVERLARYP